MRTLIIDEEGPAVNHTAMILSMFGHDAKWVIHPADGLCAIFSWQPEVIICADVFPECEVWELGFSILAAASAYKRPILMALANNPTKRKKALCEEFGFNFYLKKPVNFDIVRLIEK